MTFEPPRRARVVLVDEDEDSRETAAFALRLASFEVEAFASPAEALAVVARDAPHAVLTAILFPEMRGDVFARLLRAEPSGRRPVLVAVTGLSEALAQEGVLFDRVLLKPVDIQELAAELRRLVGARRDGGA